MLEQPAGTDCKTRQWSDHDCVHRCLVLAGHGPCASWMYRYGCPAMTRPGWSLHDLRAPSCSSTSCATPPPNSWPFQPTRGHFLLPVPEPYPTRSLTPGAFRGWVRGPGKLETKRRTQDTGQQSFMQATRTSPAPAPAPAPAPRDPKTKCNNDERIRCWPPVLEERDGPKTKAVASIASERRAEQKEESKQASWVYESFIAHRLWRVHTSRRVVSGAS